MPVSNLTVESAAEILDVLGCEHDPVYRYGKETTPRELSHQLRNVRAREVWIEFHTLGRRRKRGTVYQLVLDRIRTA